ncbi:tripartite tricarboxylate transporter substrate binding protein [Candidimonas humi]|uniref:Bug family tripartite tricarboxylate transporter substrate binding protein n=1 Tax=Candidimonas humi TaxID=683355 RepID=A0ABV8P214_9BURK|nr:tripartite tricarboxylate transporter substrate binding protein [Candidimonas humi]MBV6304579.1 tripartite tricarboxylate transporter substrate binding protein [Candidimonas humi]
MKKVLLAAVSACAVLALMRPSLAQDKAAWPTQPIHLVVPSGAGGITDTLARILAQKVGTILGQSLIVDNKPGASGIIGSRYVARANPDGYTLLMVFPSHVVNPSVTKNLPYDTAKDFAPVSKVGSVAEILLVNKDSPIKSVKDLIAAAKARPGALNYGAVGVGSLGDLCMLLFQSQAGVKLTQVAYKGDPETLSALIRGDIQAAFVAPISAMAMVKSGKLRALAISDAHGSRALPEIPPVAKEGLAGFDVTGWNAVFAPAGTPKPIVDKLNHAINQALADPDLVKKFISQGVNPIGCPPEVLQQAVEHDIASIGQALKAAGVEPR